jgi:MFS family permease
VSQTTNDKPWPAAPYAWYATIVLMLAYTLSYIDRQILSMLVEPIKADLQITDTQIGFLQGLAFAAFYTLVGIPMGRLADSQNRKRIIAWGVFFWSLATAACGIAKTYWQLFAARVGVGVGEATLGPAAYSMLADLFPPERRSRAIGAYSIGVYLGIGLAAIIGGKVVGALADAPPLVLPLVGELAAWHITFLVVGLPGVLLAFWIATLREPERRGVAQGSGSVPIDEVLDFVFNRNARLLLTHFIGFSMLTLLFNATVFWMAPYLIRAHGMAPANFGVQLGTTLAIFGGVGIFAGGVFADFLRRRAVQTAELWPGIVSAMGVIPFGIATAQAESGDSALLLFAGFMFFSSFPFAAAASALSLVCPNRMRGQVSAVYLLCVNLTGIGLGSLAPGVLNDYVFADPKRVGDSIAWVIGIAAPLAALLLAICMAPYRRAVGTR